MIAFYDVSVWTEGEHVDSVQIRGEADDAARVAVAMLAAFKAESDRPATTHIERVAETRRGPLNDDAHAWLASLSRDRLEQMGRDADDLEDETLALAVIAVLAKRADDDAVETGEGDALDENGFEVDESVVGDEVPSIAGAVRRAIVQDAIDRSGLRS